MEERLTVRIGANISEFERKMSRMQGKMNGISRNMHSVGSSMTKWITAPALGAATAAAGVTAAFGWKRLVGVDNARAQLQGMGYDAKEVEGISDEVSDAIQGGMMTMAEGTATAAGAMAAGVERGAELERYLKLVDAAAVGANKPVGDMAMIFNRVQGSGKLMTQELNMIEDGMPGFSNAMAEHLGVGMEEFRNMVTEGKVSSDDFLDVMDGFAGGMAEAYSDTFSGMVQNTKAWIGILGENLLGGVFEQSKGAIKEFMDLLKSDDLQTWAVETGEKLGTAFTNIMEAIKGVVSWYLDLSSGTKKLIAAFGGLLIAAGPMLLMFSKAITFASGLVTTFGPVLTSIAKAGGLLKWLAPLFGALTSPITLTVAAIAALGAGFVLAYNKSETFRNFVDGIKDKFMTAIEWIGNFKDGILGLFEDDGMKGMDILESIGISEDIRNTLWDVTGYFIEFYHQVKEQVEKVKGIFGGIIAMFKGDWTDGRALLQRVGLTEDQILAVQNGVLKVRRFFHDMRQGINDALSSVKSFFVNQFEGIRSWWDADGQMILSAISTVFEKTFDTIRSVAKFGLDFVKNLFQTFAPIVAGIWSVLWPTVVTVAKNAWSTIQLVIGTAMDVVQGIISAVSAAIEGDWSRFGQVLRETASSIKDRVTEHFGNLRQNALDLFDRLTGGALTKFTELKDGAIQKVVEAKDGVLKWFYTMYMEGKRRIGLMKLAVTEGFKLLKEGAINRVTEMYNSVTGWFSDLWTSIKNKTNDIKTGAINRFNAMKTGVSNAVSGMRDRAVEIYRNMKDRAAGFLTDMVDGAKKLPSRIGNAIKNAASFAVDGVKSLGNKMASSLENVLNGVVNGLNSLLEKIGLDDLLPKVNIDRFSTGTAKSAGGYTQAFSTGTRNGRIASDMLGILNDKGPGNGRGGAVQELIERNGKLLVPKGRDVKVALKQGDRIYNGAEVQSMQSAGILPRFSSGTGTEGGNSGGRKGLLGTLGDVLGNVWDYITNPGKAFKAVIDNVTGSFDNLSGFGSKMASGVFGLVKEQGLKWLTGIFDDNGGALGTGRKGSFMNYRMTTPYSPNAPVPGYPTSFNGGRHYGIDYGTPIGTPVHATMSGRLSQFWNEGGGKIAKLVTGNLRQFFMHMQSVAPSGNVKAGDVIGKTGNSGRWTTGPHVHWQAQQGTDALNRNTVNPLKVVGHANGGIFRNRHIAEINEEGPEAIIPLSAKRRGRANNLYDSVGKALGRDDNKNQRTMIENQQKQIDRLDKAIGVLLGIESKSGINADDVGRANDAYNAHMQQRQAMKTGRLSYDV